MSDGFWAKALMAIAALAVSPGAAACDADKLIRHYGMQTVPKEGVWFTVTYESADRIDGAALPPRYGGRSHPAVSAIVALETAAAFSALHRLKTDETWHFYGGDPIDLLLLPPDGQSRRVVLGSDVLAGQTPQFTVPAGVWQGSSPLAPKGKGCSLFGTELAPAFAYEDFEIGYRDQLTAGYPAEASRIAELTRAEFAVAPATTPAAARPEPQIGSADTTQTIAGAPGVSFKELLGRAAALRSTRMSAALFTVDPGHATPLSFTHDGEEVFLVVAGEGAVQLGNETVPVKAGSTILVPPQMPRSVIAGAGGALSFYALIAPAWQAADDSIVTAPAGK
jgi:predicted cupin superfamily sugar epimerase/mannose-6-phosphate isomerase-like protein (cupin superfamily)